MLFQYRQVQQAAQLFALAELAVAAGAERLWLHNATGARCTVPQAWGTADPLWNFSDPAAAAFWVDRIAQQLARDSSLAGASAGAGAAVFFDDADEGSCGMTIPGNCDFS